MDCANCGQTCVCFGLIGPCQHSVAHKSRTSSNFLLILTGDMEASLWQVVSRWRNFELLSQFTKPKDSNLKSKKAVDANIDFLVTVVKGHLLASACEELGIANPDDSISLPLTIQRALVQRKWEYISHLASQIVEKNTLIDITSYVADTEDKIYNYTRVLCHYGCLVLEFRDAWGEGDGERIFHCWWLLLPHFKASGRTKYSLEALRIQLQAKSLLSPRLAHQLIWDRFINTRGGQGNNIPNDLYNEHIVKQVKKIVHCMGPKLSEKALQTASRAVTFIHSICKQ